MHFDLNDDQRQLADSVQRVLADQCSFEQRRAAAATPLGWSESLWQAMATLGLTGLPIPESCDGIGGNLRDLLPVMKAFGGALVLEPYLATVLGATAVRAAGTPAQQQSLLPHVADGSLRLAWAHDEAVGRHASLWVETTARREGDVWVLNGVKNLVLHAQSAHQWVVSARIDGAPDSALGVRLFLVDPSAQGASCRGYRLIDDTLAGEVRLSSAVATLVGHPEASVEQALAITLAAGTAAVCADMVGAMEVGYKLTTDYMMMRKQFGRVIGENQALRHKAAECLVALEMARSMAIAAACAADDVAAEHEVPEATKTLMQAKLVVGRHARTVCQAAIQIHGGIGMTEEYAVGNYLRRVTVMEQLFGDVGAQATRLAALA